MRCALCRACRSAIGVRVWFAVSEVSVCDEGLRALYAMFGVSVCDEGGQLRVVVRRCLIAARRLAPPCLIGAFRRLRCVGVTAQYVRSSRRCA